MSGNHLELLAKLKSDLDQLASANLDEETQELVEGMREDIADVLSSSSVPPFFSQRLSMLAMEFESSHPNLTAFVTQVANALSNAGL